MNNYKVLPKAIPYESEFGEKMRLRAVITEYTITNSLAILLECLVEGEEYWESYADVTVALPESSQYAERFGENVAFLHINNITPKLYKKLEELGMKKLKYSACSGYVDFPLCDFSAFIKNLSTEEAGREVQND